jgi:hypothetical protein
VRDKVVVGCGIWERSWKGGRVVLIKDNHGTIALRRDKGWLPLPIVVVKLEAEIEFAPKLPDSDKTVLLIKASE